MPNDDPRLRILDPTAGALAEPILAALDGTTVLIHLGRDVIGSARVAAGAMAAMTARLFGHVEVHSELDDGTILPPNWWGVSDITELASRAAQLTTSNPHAPARTITVTVGAAHPDDVNFGIGGGDYTALIARYPVPIHSGEHHLGVHAAACLAISQLLGMVLRDHGLGVVELDRDYQLDLLTHRPVRAETGNAIDDNANRGDTRARTAEAEPEGADRGRSNGSLAELIFAGAGSVGSSAIALTAIALAPTYTGRPAPPGLAVEVVDLDRFDPARNPFRYPALLGGETEDKAETLAARLRTAGLAAVGYRGTVAAWTAQRDLPGVRGLLVSSVDTLTGRLEVADVLAEQTLSIGVSGLVLHGQRERMDGTAACPFCDYVDTAPVMTQADVYVELTGLDFAQVLRLLDGASQLTEQDVAAAVAAGKLPAEHALGLTGRRLEDLVNRVYAEAQIRTSTGTPALTVAFPQVSWFAGVLAAVEIVKQVRGLPLLQGRVDVDLAGLPPGALRAMPADPSGRCLCHSALRRRTYLGMYSTQSAARRPLEVSRP